MFDLFKPIQNLFKTYLIHIFDISKRLFRYGLKRNRPGMSLNSSAVGFAFHSWVWPADPALRGHQSARIPQCKLRHPGSRVVTRRVRTMRCAAGTKILGLLWVIHRSLGLAAMWERRQRPVSEVGSLGHLAAVTRTGSSLGCSLVPWGAL
jgi:hypothetical protein